MIKNIVIKNLYGKDYDISFFQDITLLVGKNGSGKTTILDLINLIISGNLTKICEYQFQYLKLEFHKNKNNFEVFRENDSYIIRYMDKEVNLKNKKEEVIFFTDYTNIDQERNNPTSKNIKSEDAFKMISVDEKSNKNLSAMRRKLLGDFELVYVPLNRKVSWVSNNIWVKKNSFKEGVDSVQVAENYLISYRSFIKNIEQRKNEATKEKMIDIFSEPIEFDLTKFYSIDKIEEFRIQYRKEFDEKIIKNIDKLFEQYEINKLAFEKRMSSGPSDTASSANSIINYQLSLVQLYKINEILNYIKEEFDWLHKKRADLNLIITNINRLFKDTNKTLFIDDERNCLFFRNNTDSKNLEITHLSSGEKQLLMFYIFSMATFTNKKGNSSVVLFDEPELSLHIEWQEKLLSSIKKNNSLKQIIIATHSPDLIGEYVSNCVEVVGKDG